MSIFTWISDFFGFSSALEPSAGISQPWSTPAEPGALPTTSPLDEFTINPASGLPMVGGIGGVDVGGNPYGMDSSYRHVQGLDISLDSSLSGSGIGGVDVGGNPYGMDSSHTHVQGLDISLDDWLSGSGGSSLDW